MEYPGKNDPLIGTAESGRRPMLMDVVHGRLRVNHYSLKTEKAYVYWIRRYISANRGRHPREMGGAEVEAFLTRLAVQHNVSASTQNQALSALLLPTVRTTGLSAVSSSTWLTMLVRLPSVNA